MLEQGNNLTAADKSWYVMVHLSPQWIETMLYKDSHGKLSEEGGRQLPSYDYFVPFQYLRPSVSDDLRNDFHNFVFIQASAVRIHGIVSSEWNKTARLHLRHYRDTNGLPVIITDEEMQQLRSTLQDMQLKFFFGQPVGDMAVGDTVVLQFEPWKGRMGKIERISVRKGQVVMTVGINIMRSTKSVKFEDVHDGDVVFADEERGRLMSGDLLQNFENEMVGILGHRYREKVPDRIRRDRPRLSRLLSFSTIQIDDTDDYKRFTALMLLCTHLLYETDARQRYLSQIEQWLSGVDQPRTATEAYLMIALYVCTRNPKFRDAAKAYLKSHPDCPDIIRRFLTKVRDL